MATNTVENPNQNRPMSALDVNERFKQEVLNPWPRFGWRSILLIVFLVVFYAWGVDGTQARPAELIAGWPNMVDFFSRTVPPNFEVREFDAEDVPIMDYVAVAATWFGVDSSTWTFNIPEAIPAIIETIQMAVIGTTLASVLSIPFAVLAARNTSPHPLIYQVTRFLLNINRAIPEIVYALILVAAVGLGPFGGVMALAVGSIGSLSKLYAEAIESIDPQQLLAIRATGATRFLTFIFGAVPQVAPLITSYSLLFFESNVRTASILGLVGAGGVGFILNKYIALFKYPSLMGALIILVIAVTIIDRISDQIRKRLI